MKTTTIVALVSIPFVCCGGCLSLGLMLNVLDPPPANQPATNQPAIATQQKAQATPTRTRPSATIEGFNRLAAGMSYAEVLAIIGEPTEEMSRSTIGDDEAVLYRWANGIGSVTVLFHNGRLATKAQAGLR